MNRRNWLVLGGLVVLAIAVARRRRRRRWTRIEIEDIETRDGTDAVGVSSVELESVEGIGPAYAERLREAGIEDGADLLAADPGELATTTGIGERRLRDWIERVEERTEAW